MSSAYHPQLDGSKERANRTVTQMLRQCIHPNQKDWVVKLPAIDFAINSARSESTGYAPFFLNFGRMPQSMIWDSHQTPNSHRYVSLPWRRKWLFFLPTTVYLQLMLSRPAMPIIRSDRPYHSMKEASFICQQRTSPSLED